MDNDAVIIGAGTAGLMCAIALAERGAGSIVIEKSDDIGGTLHWSSGQMSGAGTRLQRERGIEDSPGAHYEDAMRICHGKANPMLLRLSVENQGDVIDWLQAHDFDMAPEVPVIYHGHEAYLTARTYWGNDAGLSILDVLRREIDRATKAGLCELRLGDGAESLLLDDGRVAGVRTQSGVEIRGSSTVITTGGYAANPAVFSEVHDGLPLYSGAWPGADGSGIRLAQQVDGDVAGGQLFLPTFGGFLDHLSDPPRYGSLIGLIPQYRQPWEILVNSDGDRFVAEDEPSVDIRERALMAQPEMRAWLVRDARIAAEAPSIFHDWPEDREAEFMSTSRLVFRADSVDELALRIGADPLRLSATIDAYNSVVAGAEDSFGRKHAPLPIAEPPFEAFETVGMSVKSYAGIRVNESLQVITRSGQAVTNLYVAGEALGGSNFSGDAFVGGMSVTPALALGRLLGRELLPVKD